MLAGHDADPRDEDAAPARLVAIAARGAPIERHGYQPPASHRVFGGLGTLATGLLLAAGFLATIDRFVRPPVVAPPLTVLSIPADRPPQPRPVEQPRPIRKIVAKPEPQKIAPPPPPIVPLPSLPAAAASPKVAVDVKPQIVAPAPAPVAPPVPPAPPAASHGPDKWEGRVLARLEEYRRYPGDARRARQQGTAYIRFRVDRSGHVLSAALDRSSGFPALDEAALDTLHRADPLPKIPPDRPDEVELLVPMEFFIR